MEKSSRDSRKIAAEAQHGLIAQVLKDILFSLPRRDTSSSSGSSSVNETRTAAEAEADDTKIDVDVEDRIDTEEETKKRVSDVGPRTFTEDERTDLSPANNGLLFPWSQERRVGHARHGELPRARRASCANGACIEGPRLDRSCSAPGPQ